MKKLIQKKIICDLPTLIFSRYETGTTGIFFTPKYSFPDQCTFYCKLVAVAVRVVTKGDELEAGFQDGRQFLRSLKT
jgi:hypothetical protein